MVKKWLQAIGLKKGALRQALGVPKGRKIAAGRLASAAKAKGRLGRMARLAKTMRTFRKRGK